MYKQIGDYEKRYLLAALNDIRVLIDVSNKKNKEFNKFTELAEKIEEAEEFIKLGDLRLTKKEHEFLEEIVELNVSVNNISSRENGLRSLFYYNDILQEYNELSEMMVPHEVFFDDELICDLTNSDVYWGNYFELKYHDVNILKINGDVNKEEYEALVQALGDWYEDSLREYVNSEYYDENEGIFIWELKLKFPEDILVKYGCKDKYIKNIAKRANILLDEQSGDLSSYSYYNEDSNSILIISNCLSHIQSAYFIKEFIVLIAIITGNLMVNALDIE